MVQCPTFFPRISIQRDHYRPFRLGEFLDLPMAWLPEARDNVRPVTNSVEYSFNYQNWIIRRNP